MARKGRTWTHDGKTLNAIGWAKELGISRLSFLRRVRINYPLEKIFALGPLPHIPRRRFRWNNKMWSLSDLASQIPISPRTMHARLKRMTVDEAMTFGKCERKERLLTHNGKTQNISAWAREIGMTKQRLSQRLSNRSVAQALTPGPLQYTYAGETHTMREWVTILKEHRA